MIAFLMSIIIANEQFRDLKSAIKKFLKLQLFAYVSNSSSLTVFNFSFNEILLMFAKLAVTALRSKLFNENSISINQFKRQILKRTIITIF